MKKFFKGFLVVLSLALVLEAIIISNSTRIDPPPSGSNFQITQTQNV